MLQTIHQILVMSLSRSKTRENDQDEDQPFHFIVFIDLISVWLTSIDDV